MTFGRLVNMCVIELLTFGRLVNMCVIAQSCVSIDVEGCDYMTTQFGYSTDPDQLIGDIGYFKTSKGLLSVPEIARLTGLKPAAVYGRVRRRNLWPDLLAPRTSPREKAQMHRAGELAAERLRNTFRQPKDGWTEQELHYFNSGFGPDGSSSTFKKQKRIELGGRTYVLPIFIDGVMMFEGDIDAIRSALSSVST